MAEKSFGVKEINLIGASGTPTIESPNNLNLNAVNVAISTNATIGGNLTVSGTVGIAGTLTYEDVTNIDAIGIVTARTGLKVLAGGANVVGVVTATSFTGSGANLTGIAVTEAPVTDYTITGDGGNYYFHGGGVDETAGDPDLYLIRGQKYRFNNTTGSSHPFKFRVSSGGSAYTDGISGDDEGVQFFTVPYAAPASIVYQCSIHSGMVGNIYIRGGASTANISNNADNRIITGGSGGNLNAESTLTFDTTNGLVCDSGTVRCNNGFSSDVDLIFNADANNNGTNAIIFKESGSEKARIDSSGNVNIGSNTSSNPFTYLRFGASLYGAADIRPTNDGSHKVGLSFYTDGTQDTTINPTERLRITSDGKLIKGHTSNIAQIRTQYQTQTQLYGSSNSTGLKIGTFSNDAYAGNLEFVKSRSATIGTNTLVQNNDGLGSIYWGAADGSQYQPAAIISANMDGSTGTNDIPTRLTFSTASDGANGPTERLRITSGGELWIGTTSGISNSGYGGFSLNGSSGSLLSMMHNGTEKLRLFGHTNPSIQYAGDLTFYSGVSGGTERARITSDGYLQQHKLIAVSYSDTRELALSNTDLTTSNFYNTTNFASDNSILDSNGHFVAPVHGIYRLYCRFTTDNVSGNRANVRLRKNGNTINEAYCANQGSSTNYMSVSSEIIMELDVNEYLDIQVAQLHTMSGSQHKVVNFHMLG